MEDSSNRQQRRKAEASAPVYRKKKHRDTPLLSTAIFQVPKPLDSTKDEYRKIVELNDKILMQDRTRRKSHVYTGIALLITVWLITLLAGLKIIPVKDNSGIADYIYMVTMILLWAAPGCLILYGLLIPRKHLVLDREHGIITIPRVFWRKSATFPFDEGTAAIMTLPGGGGTVRFKLELWPNEKRSKGGTLRAASQSMVISELEEYWSFIVWYMDKNRPLPPGKLFDPYRQADYKRRKAEGFPPPLYASYVPLPEWQYDVEDQNSEYE